MPSIPRPETHLKEYGGFKIGDKVKWKPETGKVNRHPLEVSDIIEIMPNRVWVGIKEIVEVLPDGRRIVKTTGGDDTINEIERV